MGGPPRRDTPALPWQVGDYLVLYLTTGLGGIMIAVSWFGASGTAELSTQIGWANLGVGGVIVAGTGNVVWLLAVRRAVGERQRDLLASRAGTTQMEEHAADVHAAASLDALVTAARMTSYHRPDCLLVAGKAVDAATEQEHRATGRRPCPACLAQAAEEADNW